MFGTIAQRHSINEWTIDIPNTKKRMRYPPDAKQRNRSRDVHVGRADTSRTSSLLDYNYKKAEVVTVHSYIYIIYTVLYLMMIRQTVAE